VDSAVRFGLMLEDLKFSWRLCRKARKRGKNRPIGSFEIVSDTDTGYIYRHGEMVYVVIDGSDNFKEWIKNFLWFRLGQDHVSAGFLKTAVEMSERVEELLYSGERVIGVGHSRGGAVVQKLCLELQRKHFNVESIVTFGAPKVGGFRFCREMREHGLFHVRVTAPSDPVPTLPKIRGRHFETVKVSFENRFDLFDLHAVSRIVKGVIQHLSYGALLNSGRVKWKY